MSDLEGQIGACETDIHGDGGILERLERLEEANDAIADVQDETVWYLEETRGGTKALGVVLGMLAKVVEKIVPQHMIAPHQMDVPDVAPEMFVPTPNRADRRRIARNGRHN